MEPLKTGLAGLKQIGDVLRHPPHVHHWDFTEIGGRGAGDFGYPCGSHGCAVGLVEAVWPNETWSMFGSIAKLLKLPTPELGLIFGLHGVVQASKYYSKAMKNVTAEDVANAIDAYIAKNQPQLPTLAIIITTPQKAVREAA